MEGEIDLFRAFDGFGLRAAQRPREDDEIAVCPNSRRAGRTTSTGAASHPRIERTLLALEGVDLTMRMGDHPDGEAIIRGEALRGVEELRSRRAATTWTPRRPLGVEGDLDLLGLKLEDDRISSPTYPDAPSRVWSALPLPHGGRGAGLRPPGLRVPRLGRSAPRRRRLGTARASELNAVLIWTGTGPEKASRSSGRSAHITPMALAQLWRSTWVI